MSRRTPALMRGFDILELFLRHSGGLTMAEIGVALDLPRTTVHELVATLVDRGYMGKDPATGKLRLGPSAFHLGNAFTSGIDLHEVGNRVATVLSASCDETVHVAVLRRPNDAYLLCKIESTHSVRMVSRVGQVTPASCCAVGKVLLAGLDPADVRQWAFSAPLPKMTEQTITDPVVLLQQLDEVRSSGVAYEWGESSQGVKCAASPVRDHGGTIVAAISIAVPDSRWDAQPLSYWTELAKQGADHFSFELGSR